MSQSALSRRAMLRVVTSASAAAAIPAAAEASVDNFAGDIAAMVARYHEISAERVEIYDQFENARYAAEKFYPKPPKALLNADGDLLSFQMIDAGEKFMNTSLGGHLDGLASDLETKRALLEEYDVACDAVDEARGVWRLERQAAELQRQMDRLEDQIITTPALTPAALRTKLLFADEFLEFTKNPDESGVGSLTLVAVMRDLEHLL